MDIEITIIYTYIHGNLKNLYRMREIVNLFFYQRDIESSSDIIYSQTVKAQNTYKMFNKI